MHTFLTSFPAGITIQFNWAERYQHFSHHLGCWIGKPMPPAVKLLVIVSEVRVIHRFSMSTKLWGLWLRHSVGRSFAFTSDCSEHMAKEKLGLAIFCWSVPSDQRASLRAPVCVARLSVSLSTEVLRIVLRSVVAPYIPTLQRHTNVTLFDNFYLTCDGPHRWRTKF